MFEMLLGYIYRLRRRYKSYIVRTIDCIKVKCGMRGSSKWIYNHWQSLWKHAKPFVKIKQRRMHFAFTSRVLQRS